MAITLDGNSNVSLLFSSGGRVTGDFTNATLLSRAMFQTSTANSTTGIYALPSGTATAASWQATNAADPTNASKVLIATNGSTDCQLVSGRNGTGTYLPLTFYTNGSEQMRLDSSGNLGLGVTPSASWQSARRVVQVGGSAALWSSSSGAGSLFLSNNAYFDGTNFRYLNTSGASYLAQSTDGSFSFNQAASGTAGNAISFTQAMTLDASGNLLVGTTSIASLTGNCFFAAPVSAGGNIGVGHASGVGSGNGYAQWFYNGSAIGSITQNGTTGVLYNITSDQRLKENIVDAPNALASIKAIKVRSFDWKSDGSHSEYGYIAQELLEVAPEAVHVPADSEEMMGVDFGRLTPRLVKAIQEIAARLEALENK